MHSKSIISFSLLLGLLFAAACRKKGQADETPAPVTTTPAPHTPTNFYGISTTGTYTFIYSNGNISGVAINAYFSNQAVSSVNPATAIKAGTVFLNNDSLSFNTANSDYEKSLQSLSSETWSVTGGNGIPAFTFTNTSTFPTCTALSNIPATLSKSAGLSLAFTASSGISNSFFLISSPGGTVSGITNTLQAGPNVISVSPAQLSQFPVNSSCYMGVLLEHAVTANFSAKDFKFIRQMQFTRQITIVP